MKNFLFLSAVLLAGLMACQPKQSLSIKIDSSGFDEFWTALDDSSKAVITSRILKENGCRPISRVAQLEMAGKEIVSTKAGLYTRNYYKGLPQQHIDTITKSIYFSLHLIDAMYHEILEHCQPEKNPGVRVYFARYDEGTSADNRIQNVVLRATCGYDDLPHYDKGEEKIVAWNYGDPCPPLCDKDMAGKIRHCKDGRYQTDGPAIVTNCK